MKVVTSIPKGVIPRIENSQKHFDFIKNNKHIKWIMIDIYVIEQLIKKDVTSLYFNPNIKVITTTTVQDDILVKYFFEKELRIIKQFNPDFHVPSDIPLYLTQPEKERVWFLNNYLKALENFYNEFKDLEIGLIPLIKGINNKERSMCYHLFNKLNINYASYYVAQYFGRGRGNRTKELKEDINTIISESGLKYLLIIGLQSKSILEKLPPQVIAVAGLNQWRIHSNIGKVPMYLAKKQYGIWKNEVEKKLSCGQNVLRNFKLN